MLHRTAGEHPPAAAPAPTRRRGATAMEYLFVLSLILVAAILGIGYLGQSTKGSAKKSSDTIRKAMFGK
jgi:hypothetical protein